MQLFYLVWCPEGNQPPRYKHTTFDDAKNECIRLARLAPGKEFYLLKAQAVAKKNDVSFDLLEGATPSEEPEDIPF